MCFSQNQARIAKVRLDTNSVINVFLLAALKPDPKETAVTLNAQQILALAPDASSASSGKGLASASKWKSTAASDTALWGECQGSGKDPYRTGVDLSDYTSKCSCPSRKFPCKHAIGLMLIHAAKPLSAGTPPEWLTTWLEGRQKRAEAKTSPKEQTPEDAAKAEKAALKRLEARGKKVETGLEEFGLWVSDQIKNGIANAPSQPYSYWETVAARLVDAQAPGLARMVRELPTAASSGTNALLEALARLNLIVSAYSKLETLSAETQADVKSAIGFTQDKAELQQKNAPRATWTSLGQILVQEDNLRVRRTYLENLETQEKALLLDFAVANQPMTGGIPIGTNFETELIYYPSNLPLRAVLKETRLLEPAQTLRGIGIDQALGQYAHALSRLPWLERYPMTLSNARVVTDGTAWYLQDEQHSLAMQTQDHWQMMALSGGHPMQVFGEYNGTNFIPLSIAVENTIYMLGGSHE